MNSSSLQKKHSPTFPEIMSAVNQVRKICDRNGTIPESEIYNETWMLRLTLALLKEIDIKNGEPISEVCQAVKSGWISEGGLKPVFKREHTTWTDAILGRVYCDENDRNVKIKDSNLLEGDEYEGVIVVEAKMASKLSPKVTHSESYNQVVRNVACLSRLVLESSHVLGSNIKNNSRVVVLAPESKIDKWQDNAGRLIKQWKDNTRRMACEIQRILTTDKRYNNGLWKHPNDSKFLRNFNEIVRAISLKSCVISWESILRFIKCHLYAHKDFSLLAEYYETTKKIYGIKNVKY